MTTYKITFNVGTDAYILGYTKNIKDTTSYYLEQGYKKEMLSFIPAKQNNLNK